MDKNTIIYIVWIVLMIIATIIHSKYKEYIKEHLFFLKPVVLVLSTIAIVGVLYFFFKGQ